jgi:transcriptional regulator with XRE-family HTH domain
VVTSRLVEPRELTRIREALGLTREQLAEALGVTRVTVWRWEAGERAIAEPAARLAERLLKERRAKKRKR